MESIVKIIPVDGGEGISPDDIRAELKRVLNSPDFKASTRRREMLVYLVEEALAGRGDQLKGYTIGVAVFRRRDDFDAQSDPVVRLEARRLRRDLDGYYVAAGRSNPLRISIPTGHYAPEIRRLASEASPTQSQKTVQDPSSIAKPSQGVEGSFNAAGTTTVRRSHGTIAAGIAAGLLVVACLTYLFAPVWNQIGNGAALTRGSALLMLPFRAYGESPETSYLASGISEQLMTDLGRFADIRLYVPPDGGALQAYDDLIGAGNRAGASFVLTGSVRAEASRIAIGAQLVNVKTAQIVWTEQFDRMPGPGTMISVQHEIGAAISTALAQPYGIIGTEVTSSLPNKFLPSMPSYDCVLRGYAYRRSFATKLHAPMLACLEEAVKRDPDYAEAWAMLGWVYMDAGRFDLTLEGGPTRAYERALDAASHAVAIDGKSVLALKTLASINHYIGNFEESERIQRKALALNPNDPDTLAQLGWRLAVRGNFKQGIPYLRQAIDRTVNVPGWYFHFIAIDNYLNGRFAEMLDTAKRSTTDGSGISWSLVAIANGALGNHAAAHEALSRMAEAWPLLGRDPAAAYRRHQATDEIVNALIKGLRKAGWTPPATN